MSYTLNLLFNEASRHTNFIYRSGKSHVGVIGV